MKIDLNCDMGEGMNNDAQIMPYISSANIACGAHAGDASIMQQTIRIAQQHNVAIGAHPSYPDREHFGRIELQLTVEELYNEVCQQIQLIQKIAREEGASLHHVKPHGALYNTAAKKTEVAEAIAKAIHDVDASLKVYGLPNSVFETVCKAMGLEFVGEGFADRTYNNEGHLTPRSMPHALITDSAVAIEQAMNMVQRGMVQTVEGSLIPMQVKTICLHGDGAHAIEFAKALHDAFHLQHIAITH